MKKMLYVLSPLLCSSLLYHQHINGMQEEKSKDVLQENMKEIIDAFTSSSDETNKPTQEAVNFMIDSAVFRSNTFESSSTKEVKEIIETEAVKNEQPSGYNWGIYFQSFISSKPNLLIKTLKNDYFQHNNTTHLVLLEESLNECIEQKDNATLLDIFKLIDQKHADTVNISTFQFPKTKLVTLILENDLFQPKNKIHTTLLEQVLNNCVDQQNDETLILLLALVDQKHKHTIKVDDDLSRNMYTHFKDIRDTKITTLRTTTIEKHKATMTNLIEQINTLEKQHIAASTTINEMIKKNEEESTEKYYALEAIKNDHRTTMAHVASISNCTLPKRQTMTTAGFSHKTQKEMLTEMYHQINQQSNNLRYLAEQLKLEEAKPYATIENKK